MLSREEFLKKKSRRFSVVALPSGGEVRLQSLNDMEQSKYETSFNFAKNGKSDFHAAKRRLLIRCMVDAEGRRIFADHEEDELIDMDGRDMAILYREAKKLTGLDSDDADTAIKNSETPQG